MLQGITGGGNNLATQGLDMLGIGPQGQAGGMQDMMKLLKQLADALGLDPQSGGKQAGGCQGGGCNKAGGSESAGGAGSVEELMRKLREMAQQNPQGLMQALNQMPGLATALQGAMMGGGGGAMGAGLAGG